MPCFGYSKGLPTSRPRQAGAPSPRSPMVPATASKLPPSSRVAEVMTTVRSSKTLSRTSIATLIGATRRTGPRRGSLASHVTSSSRSSSIRAAVSKSSSTAARATCRAASGSSPGCGLSSVWAARATSRIRPSAVARASGTPVSRASGIGSRTDSRSVAASSSASAASACRPARRAAARTEPGVSSSVIVEVTRSTSSCPSSMTRTSCSGSIWRPSKASMAMNEWFVTTTSTSRAASRERSTKHSATIGQRDPRHSSALTDTCRQARSDTPGTSSSRSPDSVSSAHVAQPHDLLAEPRRGAVDVADAT